MPDKTVNLMTILYADVSGSTKLYEKFGDDIARSDIRICIEILTRVTKSWDGEVIKTIGDELMCAFHDPSNAANAAKEMHQVLSEATELGRFQSGKIMVKVGWHHGEIEYRGKEIIGEAPVTAQQIIRMAKGEEILTSSRSIEAIDEELKEGTHPVDTVEAEAWPGKLEVYYMPWQDEEDATTFRGFNQSGASGSAGLKLTYAGQEVRLDENNTHLSVGRGQDNGLCVRGRFTSRHHAEISYRHGRFNLFDKSTNGTIVIDHENNVHRVRREEVVLTGSGTISFGGPPKTDPDAVVEYQCD